MAVGVIYVGVAAVLDRRRHGRPATPLLSIGDVALFVGLIALGPDLEVEGTSVLVVVAGVVLILLGTATGRRFTAWLGAVAVALGTVSLVAELTGNSELVGGTVLVVVGAVVVLLANLLPGRDATEVEAHDGFAAPGRTPLTPF